MRVSKNKFVEKTYPVTIEEYAVNLNKDWGSDYFTADMDTTKWKYDKACYVYDYMKNNPWDTTKFKDRDFGYVTKPEDAFKINWDV